MATEKKQVTREREALVKELTDWLREHREFWAPTFDAMRKNIAFVGGAQWGDSCNEDKYTVNVTQRHLNQSLATTYAQNPTVVIERKKRLEHRVWDGSNEQLQRAKAEMEQAALGALDATAVNAPVPPPPAEAAAIVLDYEAGRRRQQQIEGISETLQKLIEFEMAEQKPDFEGQMKSAGLRERICGAAFLGVKFQSETELVPTASAVTADIIDLMAEVQALARKIEQNPEDEHEADKAELTVMVESLKARLASEDAKVIRQGLVFDFKPATSILVDKCCRCLHEFVGARRIAEVLYWTPDQIMAQWQVDVKQDGVARFSDDGQELVSDSRVRRGRKAKGPTGAWEEGAKACVAIIYDKRAQTKYVIVEGYPDLLQEPELPWPPVKGFWPILTLKLRRVEVETNDPEKGLTIYGQSDVDLLRPMQMELNRGQEGLREHRIGAKPGGFFNKQLLDKNQTKAIGAMAANEWLGLEFPADGDIRKLMMEKPTVKLDPAVYSKEGVLQDIYLVVGTQASTLGQQLQGEKATGQAIAEQARIQGQNSEVDEQDKFLTEVARVSGEMLLQGMSEDNVRTKVGMGAKWPSSRRLADGSQGPGVITIDDCLEQLVIKIEAASSGRPNQALDIANFEKMLPLLLQMAAALGLPVEPLLRHAAKIMNFKFDIEEWLAQAQPMLPAGSPPAGNGQPGNGNPPAGPLGKPQPPGPGNSPDPAGMRTRAANKAAGGR